MTLFLQIQTDLIDPKSGILGSFLACNSCPCSTFPMLSFYSTLPPCVLNFLPLVGLVSLVGSVGLVLQAALVVLIELVLFPLFWLV